MRKIIGIILTAMGISMAISGLVIKGRKSVYITNEKDGPTSTFVAGKVRSTSTVSGIIGGIALFAVGIFMTSKEKCNY